MAQTRRNIVLGLIGAGVVGGLLFVTFRPEPIPVDLHAVSVGTLTVTVDVDGEARVEEVYEVAAPIAGLARRSPVKVGDPVSEGETIVAEVEPVAPALLDSRSRLQAEAAVREAEASLAVAETDHARAIEEHAYASSQYERTSSLVERGVATITRLEDAHQLFIVSEAALNAAKARIAQSRSSLDRARAMLVDSADEDRANTCCVALLAPSDGVVLSVDTISERPVLAGTRLLTIGDPQRLEIVVDILSSDAVRLPENARASVERWGGPPLEARLKQVDPAARTKVSALGIEEQRVDAIFELISTFGERPGLGHGFAVFLRVIEFEAEDALLVPLSATFRTDDGWAVFRAIDDRVERVPVEVGRKNSRFAVVLSGLEPGDNVVEHPNELLEDGALIVERAAF